MNASEIWAQLDTEPGESGLAFRRVHPESKRNLHLAVNLSSRRRQMRFTRPWRAGVDMMPAFPQAQGIHVESQVVGGTELTLTLELIAEDLEDVFSSLVDDLTARLAKEPDDDSATRALVQAFAKWQELLEALRATGLGALARRGLFGELWVLRNLLPKVISLEAAIEAWTGPSRANQDFQHPGSAIEVKVSTGQQPQGFVVANERELDDTGLAHLFVVHLSLDERLGGSGTTLPDAVAGLEQDMAAHPVALARFRQRLGKVGYFSREVHLYREPHYEVRAASFFRVDSGFPRIVEEDLRNGVGAVRYTVSLAACARYAVTEIDVLQVLKTGA